MATMDKILGDYAKRLAVLQASDNIYSRGIAWIEGEYVALAEARIPLMDQGFMHSDLTYDVPSVWDGRFFRLEDHLTRLEAGCEKTRLEMPLPRDEVRQILCDMVVKSGIRDAFVQIIVTRGLKGVRGFDRNVPFVNHLYMLVQPYVWVMDPSVLPHGGAAVVARTVRRIPPGAIDPTIKNHQWGDLTRGLFEADDRGATYPFLTDGDANLTEGSGFNIVLIKDGKLFTPDRGVLHGVTRKSVIDVAHANGLEVRVETVPVELAYVADEILMCTTAGGIMPITQLDGISVADGKVGPITKEIWDGYWAMHYDSAYSFELEWRVGESKL